jgi:hypothetical protein
MINMIRERRRTRTKQTKNETDFVLETYEDG